jgi:hypothetical protein
MQMPDLTDASEIISPTYFAEIKSDSKTRVRRGDTRHRQATNLDTVTQRDTDTVSKRYTADAPTGASGSIFIHAQGRAQVHAA